MCYLYLESKLNKAITCLHFEKMTDYDLSSYTIKNKFDQILELPKRLGVSGPRKMKEINAAIIADTIIRRSTISRSAISQETMLSPATVSTIVDGLIAKNLVMEVGDGESSGGRRPKLLKFNFSSGCVIGVDVGGTNISGVVTNLRGEVLLRVKYPYVTSNGEGAINMLIRVIDELADGMRENDSSVVLQGIGIGVPGLVRPNSGIVALAVNLGWKNVPLRKIISDKFQLPTFVGNDTDVAACGEALLRNEKTINNLIYVTIGTGIGAGIIIDRKLYQGSHGWVGEIGHIQVVEDGLICKCGKRGCLETVAAGPAIAGKALQYIRAGYGTKILELVNGDLNQVTAEVVSTAASQGDEVGMAIISDAGALVGKTIAYFVNFLHPDVVVIGGGVAKAGEILFKAIREKIVETSLPVMARTVKIEPSILGDDVGAAGAAALAIRQFLSNPLAGAK
ncbi:glucokinase [Candidatus Hakubella thermalkaliphila]|uniref:Glucokinase n=2 Tax=Candidatus Hakubella thermalkaliphila TaxID=2754717 RepID=A0A6V8P6B2_9ACTN|nr:glucokinase [Candidatus Hakubella thermalkaliphila]GFP42013.1 glucokinase [Candidatus Hakubella thermalkaliphila]